MMAEKCFQTFFASWVFPRKKRDQSKTFPREVVNFQFFIPQALLHHPVIFINEIYGYFTACEGLSEKKQTELEPKSCPELPFLADKKKIFSKLVFVVCIALNMDTSFWQKSFDKSPLKMHICYNFQEKNFMRKFHLFRASSKSNLNFH